MSVPKQKPGRSKQDYETPRIFLDALEKRFGKMDVDLAATRKNAKAPICLTLEEDSLTYHWASSWPDENLFLNPPFADIEPWAAKCAEEGPKMIRGRIFLLTPASIGSDWFARNVYGQAMVLGLSPRIPFDGTPINPKTGRPDGYPKDLMISVFGAGMHGFDCWRWLAHPLAGVSVRASSSRVR